MKKKDILLERYCKRNMQLECLTNKFSEQYEVDKVFEIAKLISIEASADIIIKYGEDKMYPAEIFMKFRQFVELNF